MVAATIRWIGWCSRLPRPREILRGHSACAGCCRTLTPQPRRGQGVPRRCSGPVSRPPRGLVPDGLCFRSQRATPRFWAGASVLATRAASVRFRRKTAAWARRCGRLSGRLLPHISTADTARDLDHLRVLLGEEKLTFVGLSYGTYLGQTYANMFLDRVRAMLLGPPHP